MIILNGMVILNNFWYIVRLNEIISATNMHLKNRALFLKSHICEYKIEKIINKSNG
jgi:hypothetical protein